MSRARQQESTTDPRERTDRVERELRAGCERLLQVPYSRRGPFKIDDNELRAFIGNGQRGAGQDRLE